MPDLLQHLQASVGPRFRIIRELTGGGMSRVFLAEEVALQRDVVIKVLSPQPGDEALLQRFRHEVLHTARLQHPTIVPVFECGAIDDAGTPLPYYVMPYVHGESLRSRLRREEALSLNATLRILRNLLEALACAHAHGVIHRDIKPENIFLSGNSAVLADFGVAKALAGPQHDTTLTLPGTRVGTPAYMAPEQLAGDDATDARADLYSVGVIAFEMLTGQLPWVAHGTAELLAAKVKGEHSPLVAVRPDVPPRLAQALERCLAWDPTERPQSAEELLRLAESTLSTPTPSTPMPVLTVAEPSRRRIGVTAWAIVALASLSLWLVQRRPWAEGPPEARAGEAGARDARSVRLAVLYPHIDGAVAPESTLGLQLYRQLVAALYPVPRLQLVYESEISRMAEIGVSLEAVEEKLRGERYDSALVLETVAGAEGAVQVQLTLQHLQRPRREAVGNPVVLRSRALLAPDSARALAGVLTSQVLQRFGLAAAERRVRETESPDASVARARGRDAVAHRTP
ncbi:MAG TPA: serine/threonine-protein kinase, partial [Gemmatimonadaceae bacterium]|nr:serine/threonine-protein kinase [Gemmatimonadaceae bacterium]